MKIHLHSEQFDGWMHSACEKLDAPPDTVRIVCEGLFDRLPEKIMCTACHRYWYPHGGRGDSEGWTVRRREDVKKNISDPELIDAFHAWFDRGDKKLEIISNCR